MSVIKLSTIRVEKPWGRHTLGAGFADVAANGDPMGEIWFDTPPGVEAPLMVKYLFTSERLSIQVHPNDAQARAAGYISGKEEAWIILDAEPESVLGLGTVRPLSEKELRAAALDGSLETLIDWKPVKAGDIIYLPAGTVHAIGAGITLIEVQQNVDLTYRLFDYGRPRELHLDEGVAVSRAEPFPMDSKIVPLGGDCLALVQGRKFVVEQWSWTGSREIVLPSGTQGWLIPVSGAGTIDGQAWQGGECWLIEGGASMSVDAGSDVLFAYPGPSPPCFQMQRDRRLGHLSSGKLWNWPRIRMWNWLSFRRADCLPGPCRSTPAIRNWRSFPNRRFGKD
jgi:mannose-6-phosphate isomerase